MRFKNAASGHLMIARMRPKVAKSIYPSSVLLHCHQLNRRFDAVIVLLTGKRRGNL